MNALRTVLVIAGRETRSFFLQPLAWVVLTSLLLLNGFWFWFAIDAFNARGLPSSELVRFFFSSLLFWLPLLIGLPVIAMRLIAEERQTGTIETLLTAPVTETRVVVGKYLAALFFFLVLWSPILLYIGIVEWYGDVDWWSAVAGLLGLVLSGGFLLSAAVCASTLTRNQIIAAVAGFVVVVALFFVPFLAGLLAEDETWRTVWRHADLYTLTDEFSRGIVRSSRIVYALSGIVLFLFASARLMEAFKER
jgi:ABC-2 type transport system permease protein